MKHGRQPADRRWCRTALRTLVTLVLVAATTGCISGGRAGTPNPPTAVSAGWTFTTYYTAVQRLHRDAPRQVRGCLQRECDHGNELLGSFPRSFVRAVRAEGTGRITDGPHRGRYLNWSYDTGFWLDADPVDTDGRRLRPFITAAADIDALPRYARFQIIRCGREQEDGSPIDPHVCARLRASTWMVLDAFTPGLGGRRHIDLYVGEEDRTRFPDESPWSITTRGSAIRRVGS